jgi:hypothetical protein
MRQWEKTNDLETKMKFHAQGRLLLEAYAKEVLKLTPSDYDVRSCEGGNAVLGEVTLHTDTVYIQIHRGYITDTKRESVMFRRCNGRKDYTGGANNYCHLTELSFFNIGERLKASFYAY